MTDASLAIQTAINAAAIAGGGTVFIPAGRYVLRSTLRVFSSNIVIKGAGIGETVLYVPVSLKEARPDEEFFKPNSKESRYTWENAFIEIFGIPKGSQKSTSSLLATVTAPSRRGQASVPVGVAPGKKVEPGDELYLFMSDPPQNASITGSLVAALHGWNVLDGETIPAMCGPGGDCLHRMFGEQDVTWWTVRVQAMQNDSMMVLDRPLPFDVRPEWRAEFHRFPSSEVLRDSGVESLTIEFLHTLRQPHHVEMGYNGIELRWTVDSWVRDVQVLNADNALFIRASHHITVLNVTTGVTSSRAVSGKTSAQGHIGIAVISSADVLVSDFNITAPMLHDTAILKSILTVWYRGVGANLNLDGHRHATYANLYCSINVGAGTRPFSTGGVEGLGLPLGAYTTFWGVHGAAGPMVVRTEMGNQGPCSFGGRFLAFVGEFMEEKACDGWFVWYTGSPEPPDLYEWQWQQQQRGEEKEG